MRKPDRNEGAGDKAGTGRARRATSYPIAEETLPSQDLTSGKYRLTFARSMDQLRSVQRLRFEVFNLELGEGLESSFASGLDEDDLDEAFHHLLITDEKSGEAVGTYRMQTAAMAAGNCGFYSAREFDISGFPLPVVDAAVEVGRACIAREHIPSRAVDTIPRLLDEQPTPRLPGHLVALVSAEVEKDDLIGPVLEAG